MRKLLFGILYFLLFASPKLHAQDFKIQGYVFEENNRGYLNFVQIVIYEEERNAIVARTASNREGLFTVTLPLGKNYRIKAEKDLFVPLEMNFSAAGLKTGEKLFLKMEMVRKPGYLFDVTMARKRDNDKEVVDAIQGARVEVYNNTLEKEVLVLEEHPHPTFKCTFEQGNHYTVMIRKEGFFTKRMEAFVNVEGCILCFEGVGKVQPGVSDVLTKGHAMGTLLANVELEPVEMDKAIKLENIYYRYNSARITSKSAKELDKLIRVLKDNPGLIVELGSHTDSRGKDDYNLKLSNMRAASAVEYITQKGGIPESQIKSKGYGETQLVNKCKNGVECSERRHQQNRRTELKVVGMAATDPYKNKSLAEIIAEEKFERMLEEVQNSEVIKVKEGEELPEEIQKQTLDKAKEDPSSAVEEKVDPPKEEMPTGKVEIVKSSASIQGQESSSSSSPEAISTKEKALEQEQPHTTVLPTEVKTSQTTLNPSKTADTQALNTEPESVTETLSTTESTLTPPETKELKPSTSSINKDDDKEELEDFGGEFEEASPNEEPGVALGGIAEEREINIDVDANRRSAKLLPSNYTGYRIEFFSSPYQLPISHEIFSRHGDIAME
ncbi:MAG: OmpA family protein, partial [Bacteroidota bacterium]